MTDSIKNIELENRNADDINAVREVNGLDIVGSDVVESYVSWVQNLKIYIEIW